MTTCYQCDNRAMYLVGEQRIPLCLNCNLKAAQIAQINQENLERVLNYSHDEIDSMLGFNIGGPRFPPRPRPVHVGDVRLNNISVSNSVVGTINTGSIGSLDQSISGLIQLGESGAAQAFKALTEAVINSDDLSRNQKNEIVEALNVISREAATPPEQRQRTVATSLLERIERLVSVANDVSEIFQRHMPSIISLFNAASG